MSEETRSQGSAQQSSGGNRPERSDRPEREGGGDQRNERGPRGKRPRYRKKVLDTRNLKIDYKHPEVLERFISKTGKILPRRMTGATARVQRKIAREIKRARQIGLLPFTRR